MVSKYNETNLAGRVADTYLVLSSRWSSTALFTSKISQYFGLRKEFSFSRWINKTLQRDIYIKRTTTLHFLLYKSRLVQVTALSLLPGKIRTKNSWYPKSNVYKWLFRVKTKNWFINQKEKYQYIPQPVLCGNTFSKTSGELQPNQTFLHGC